MNKGGKGKGKGKGKDKPLTKEEKAKAAADAVNDIENDEYKLELANECWSLLKMIKWEEDLAGLFQDERQRINYFWIVSKKELDDKQAEQRNKEREFEDLKEKHQIEIKVYQQRVKHLLFQNLDKLTELKLESEVTLKNQEDEHWVQSRELKADVWALKVQEKEQLIRQEDYMWALQKDNNKKQSSIRAEYERLANEIKLKYTNMMLNLWKKMEEKRKRIISQIENKKNQAIKDLTLQHEKKYTNIKNYY